MYTGELHNRSWIRDHLRTSKQSAQFIYLYISEINILVVVCAWHDGYFVEGEFFKWKHTPGEFSFLKKSTLRVISWRGPPVKALLDRQELSKWGEWAYGRRWSVRRASVKPHDNISPIQTECHNRTDNEDEHEAQPRFESWRRPKKEA